MPFHLPPPLRHYVRFLAKADIGSLIGTRILAERFERMTF